MIFYILLTTIIPVVAFLLYTLLFVNSGLKETAFDSKEMEIRWGQQYLEQVTDQLDDIVYSIHLEPELLSLVDNSSTDYGEIEAILRSTLYNNSKIIDKIVVVSMNTYRGVSYDYENGYASKIYSYDNLLLNRNDETHGLTFMSPTQDMMVVHTINDFDTQRLEGVILLKLSNNAKDELESILGKQSRFILYTSKEDIIDNNDDDDEITLDPSSHFQSVQRDNDVYIWTKQVGNYDLYLSSLVPVSEINSFSRNMIQVGLLIIVLSFVFSVGTALFFTNDITSPIVSVVNHMRSGQLVKFDGHDKTYQEITYLETAYNQMINEINTLITEKYRNKIERQSIQLKALQAQINPHFLSNTFQLIGGMALSHGANDLYDATIKMSNLVRYSMRIDQEAVAIEQELQHVKEYLDIQKLRFDDQLDFIVDIDANVLAMKVPKFTFQPILENSFKYGLKKVERTWQMSITGSIDDAVHIHIKDNGIGMSADKIETINKRFSTNNMDFEESEKTDKISVGLMNIDSRIKLLYGPHYGLHISQNSDNGITVSITIPKGVK
jgi:two-component system sensor histidine kinase YesM